jgi:hypothetical protein
MMVIALFQPISNERKVNARMLSPTRVEQVRGRQSARLPNEVLVAVRIVHAVQRFDEASIPEFSSTRPRDLDVDLRLATEFQGIARLPESLQRLLNSPFEERFNRKRAKEVQNESTNGASRASNELKQRAFRQCFGFPNRYQWDVVFQRVHGLRVGGVELAIYIIHKIQDGVDVWILDPLGDIPIVFAAGRAQILRRKLGLVGQGIDKGSS